MKKIMFAVMAMIAIGFTSCGNKTQAPAEATASISALSEQIEAQDASKFQEVLATVQEKIKAFAGENAAVQTALAALTEAPADAVVSGLMQAVEGVKDAAGDAVDAAGEAVDAAGETIENKANEVKDAAKGAASDAVDQAADGAKKALGL